MIWIWSKSGLVFKSTRSFSVAFQRNFIPFSDTIIRQFIDLIQIIPLVVPHNTEKSVQTPHSGEGAPPPPNCNWKESLTCMGVGGSHIGVCKVHGCICNDCFTAIWELVFKVAAVWAWVHASAWVWYGHNILTSSIFFIGYSGCFGSPWWLAAVATAMIACLFISFIYQPCCCAGLAAAQPPMWQKHFHVRYTPLHHPVTLAVNPHRFT